MNFILTIKACISYSCITLHKLCNSKIFFLFEKLGIDIFKFYLYLYGYLNNHQYFKKKKT